MWPWWDLRLQSDRGVEQSPAVQRPTPADLIADRDHKNAESSALREGIWWAWPLFDYSRVGFSQFSSIQINTLPKQMWKYSMIKLIAMFLYPAIRCSMNVM